MTSVRQRTSLRNLIAVAALVPLCWSSIASASFVFANFEDGTPDGFGTGTNSGVTANMFSSPTSGVIDTGPSTDPTNVLDLTASGFNGGLSSGAALAYDFVQQGTIAQFMANDEIVFDWIVPVSSATGGYSQLYNIILNGQGAGYTNVGGSSGATSTLASVTGTVNQNPSFAGQVNQVTINYDAYKAALSASPGYMQLEFQTNDGGGAPSDILFDNFQLVSIPEPASISLLACSVIPLLARRRRKA
ncbi:MAG TPA: hypothetical protein VL992_12985 [Tepidisphaeraceae bacterium]|nr:hypothetical protein [Tepidisphaeraceae bacterium]